MFVVMNVVLECSGLDLVEEHRRVREKEAAKKTKIRQSVSRVEQDSVMRM